VLKRELKIRHSEAHTRDLWAGYHLRLGKYKKLFEGVTKSIRVSDPHLTSFGGGVRGRMYAYQFCKVPNTGDFSLKGASWSPPQIGAGRKWYLLATHWQDHVASGMCKIYSAVLVLR
jgi:hypothetical protein